MIISCIGDSLTEGDYGIPGKRCIANVHPENYPYFLSQITGVKVNNFGHSGFRSSNILALFDSGDIDVTGSNVIIILLGTNGGQTPEGTSPEDLAYLEIINRCQKQASEAVIYLCTPPNATRNPNYSNCGYEGNVVPARLFVRKVAKELNLNLIDLALDPHFTPETEHIMQPNDGLHFTETGYRTLAEVIYEEIKDNLK